MAGLNGLDSPEVLPQAFYKDVMFYNVAVLFGRLRLALEARLDLSLALCRQWTVQPGRILRAKTNVTSNVILIYSNDFNVHLYTTVPPPLLDLSVTDFSGSEAGVPETTFSLTLLFRVR